jgi:aminoglycoside phosphotransferase (APT) family kinase protein
MYEDMAAVLAGCISVDVERVGLADYGKPGNYYARQIGRWSQQYRRGEDRTKSRRWIA